MVIKSRLSRVSFITAGLSLGHTPPTLTSGHCSKGDRGNQDAVMGKVSGDRLSDETMFEQRSRKAGE